MPRRPFAPSAIVTLIVLTALLVFLFWLPLRPTAWGGPRGDGPFESEHLPGAGWFARDARLYLERFAAWRSPARTLEATAEALAGFHALLSFARYGVLWLVLRRLGGSGWLAALGVGAAALPMAFGTPRQDQYEVGLLLFVVMMAVTMPARPPWWVAAGVVPTLFAVWANAHTSAVTGLAWLVILTIGRGIEWWRAWGSDGERPAVGRWLVATVLGVAAACLNPDGPRLFADAFLVTKNPGLATLPAWQPVDFSRLVGMPWGYFATLVVLFLAQLASPRPYSPTALAVILSFGFWPLVQQRGLLYWWLIVPCLVIPHVQAALDARLMPNRSVGRTVPAGAWRGVIVGVLAAAVMTTPAVRWFLTGAPRPLASSTTPDTPWRVALELTASETDAGQHLPELSEIVRTAYPNGKYRGAILCGEEQGDFLGWVLDGDNSQPVMIYSRPEAIEPGHWAEARSALGGASDWWETLGRHQVNLIVIDPGQWTRLAERLRKSKVWRIVQDNGAGGLLVAVRREPKLPVELLP